MRGPVLLLTLAVLGQAGKLDLGIFTKYTETDTGCPCWWDLTRDDCACCTTSEPAVQCGFPMHKYCYKPSNRGCPGIPASRWTLSTRGHPCYWKQDRTDECAWCATGGYQCGTGKRSSPPRNHCYNGRNKKYCDAVIGDCRHITNACDPNATCKFSKKFASFRIHKCVCNPGYTGNGVQCFDQDGNLSQDPSKIVEVEMTLNSDFYVYPHESEQFPFGPELDTLFSEMNAVVNACTGGDCTSTVV
ncbi:uncharacterized protein LOC111707593 [Eurytemora carolleeae]|uniref:uncharacterized protein LOC111707593 n=1 Tax=Eurytemora carolleeae TaxID=1294199 RepID=UPI000C7762AF|nr:uncharacterized protein LOC111707593 [Eurytemora carolleeae]|eukprot:XP_023336493.1 uncharacterized protein LOC111707593 [Eurytemora affinis]